MKDLTKTLAELSPKQRDLLLQKLNSKKSNASIKKKIRPITRETDQFLPSYSQERLWFIDQLIPNSAAYNISGAVKITGKLDPAIIEQSFNEIIKRHEILRTRFIEKEGRVWQQILPQLELKIELIDLSLSETDSSPAELIKSIKSIASIPFDLSKDPLLRVKLLRLSAAEHILLVIMHHIISDGWSLTVFINELAETYQALSIDGLSRIPQLPVQFVDYVYWQRESLQELEEKQLKFWKDELAGIETILEIPADYSRPAVQSDEGAIFFTNISGQLTDRIKELSNRENVSLFMTLMAAFQTLLYRYTDQESFIIGTPIAGRNEIETEALIGPFINTLPIKAELSGNPTFRDYLRKVADTAQQAYQHQQLPFERLVEALHIEHDLSHTPLFQVMLVYQQDALRAKELPGLVIQQIPVDTGTSQFDLCLSVTKTAEGLALAFEYSTRLFKQTTIERLSTHFSNLLEQITIDPAVRITDIPLLTDKEEQQILFDWNSRLSAYPQDKCIHQVFEEQVRLTPENVAVVYRERQITYRELNHRANQLAHYLQRFQLAPEDIVGICLDRSEEMIIAVLAVLKAGAAYLPLDPAYPQERIDFAIDDTKTVLIITQQDLLARLPQDKIAFVCLDRDWREIADCANTNIDVNEIDITPANLAYCIYTSGSTGRPKGVVVTHANLVHSTFARCDYYQEKVEKYLLLSPLAFDSSIAGIFWALCTGGALQIVDNELQQDSYALANLLTTERISHLLCVPVLYSQIVADLNNRATANLKVAIVAGDACNNELIALHKQSLPTTTLYNEYGPTEGTVWATVYRCDAEITDGPVPIGRPIGNVKTYLLDSSLNPVPIGVAGELYIAGDGIARGYLNRPGVTAERFLADHFNTNLAARMYRTGDLARFLDDGNIEFLGRVDNQVKIRGFRIELGEIEARLSEHPSVDTAIVIAREDEPGQKRLVAYLVANQQPLAASELRTYLRESLPEYMLPSAFVMLEALPLSPNGKIDRKALPRPEFNQEKLNKKFVAPRTAIEEIIAGIWSQLLGIGQIGIHDNFFELGGHSLIATQVMSRIRTSLQTTLPLRDLFESPVLADFAEKVKQAGKTIDSLSLPKIEPADRSEPLPLSFSQQRLWFLDQLESNSQFYNIPAAVKLTGKLNLKALNETINEIVARHEILRTRFATIDGQPIQLITRSVKIEIPIIELATGLSRAEQEQELLRIAVAEASQPFNLAIGPLLRAKIVRLSEQENLFLLTMHHIVSDGWSIGIFIKELAEIYQAFSQAKPSPLLPLPIQFVDFACWQRDWFQGDVLQAQLDYWKSKLTGLTVLQLPTDRPRPAEQSYLGSNRTIQIDRVLYERLQAITRQEQVTIFMLLLAGFKLMLYRYSQQRDITVGTPIANRNNGEIEPLIGLFINTLVLRTELSGELSFRELLQRVRETSLDAYAHQDMPFERLVNEIEPERDMSRNPLFQVMFMLQNMPIEPLALAGLEIAPIEIDFQIAKFDLTLIMQETDHGITGSLNYSTALFDDATIERMANHYLRLLEAIVDNLDRRIADLPMLNRAEEHQLLVEWNATARGYSQDSCIHQLFSAQAARTPDRIAVRYQSESLNYRELNIRANRLAHYLQQQGAEPETIVGICLNRSLEMIIAMLAVLKAGAAYLPLDPTYPKDRIAFIVEDAGAKLILTEPQLLETLPSQTAQLICLDKTDQLFNQLLISSDQDPVSDISSEDIAYLIYTSGSTGKPKGVMVNHRNVVNFFAGMDDAIGGQLINESPGVWLAVTSISFDISVLELLWTLANGYEVVIQSEQQWLSNESEFDTAVAARPIDFSLFYFANEAGANKDRYRLLLEGAKFADRHGFSAVWTPERHFHSFGGLYPNPSVISAALSTITEHIQLRAGSVVVPLHNPIRVAEEWSVVDNLSNGRVGISFASGWHAQDFVFIPENYANRKEIMFQHIDTVRRLWRGESVACRDGVGNNVEIKILPRPIQPELPVWVTAAGNPETFQLAGEIGANLLTHLLGQSIETLKENVARYRAAWQQAGHDETGGKVSLMLHTFVAEDMAMVREQTRLPFRNYLRGSIDLLKNLAVTLGKDVKVMTEEDLEAVLDHAYERYFETSGLMGTPASCLKMVNRLKAIGIDEIACLIDFGIDSEAVISNLNYLEMVKDQANSSKVAEDYSIAAQIERHNVTHLQCTPSMARMLAIDPATRHALSSLDKLMLGGEALPISLAEELSGIVTGEIHNMYGPTETTIWSTTVPLNSELRNISIGRPIANTEIYIVDQECQPLPIGVAGELLIGGNGVVRGYLAQPELTAEKFIPDPFSAKPGSRLYKTGDLAKFLPNGNIEFLGRVDYQVKIRGHRIECGEIEAKLSEHPAIAEVVVVAKEDPRGDKRLVAYVVAKAEISSISSELRDFLKDRLPDYMIPAFFVQLPVMPLTPNGKVDRKVLLKLEQHQPEISAIDALPRNEVETRLAAIWRELLNLDQVGINSNFFELGGDSILSIQLVAKANQAGIGITARQIFEHQTIAELAAVSVLAKAVDAEQGIVIGELPLMPIQRWFFEQQRAESHHYNHALLLKLKERINVSLLRQAVVEILRHHDALRLRFLQTETDWQQFNADINESTPFSVEDLSDIADVELSQFIEAHANRLQASLNLNQGPLMRVALFDCGAARESRLLIVIHHLAIDGISWRIILEDLQALYDQLNRQAPVRLPAKTTSYQEWSSRLNRYATSEAIKNQLSYWQSLPWEKITPLPRDYPDGINLESAAKTIYVSLSQRETSALLQQLPEVYHTQINDILLTALLKAYTSWTGAQYLAVDLEGHGREEIISDVDISRTVGWFTSLFPVLLMGGANGEPGRLLKSVKEQLRSIPDRGIGYGILRYLADQEIIEDLKANPAPEITFNYLGQTSQTLSTSTLFAPADERAGQNRSLKGKGSYLIEVIGIILDGRLQIGFSYYESIHLEATIASFAEGYLKALTELIDHCLSPEAGGFTPSDFPLAKIDQQSLERLESGYRGVSDIADIYPLSPIQEGILFHTLYESQKGVYFLQVSCTLTGELNTQLFEQAWQRVVARHPILRTGFVWQGLERPLQIENRAVELKLTQLDWVDLPDQSERLAAYLQQDKERGFNFEQAPLLRLSLIRLAQQRYKLVWSYHHLILDGWSLPIVFAEVMEIYDGLREGREVKPRNIPSYRDYIGWLQQQNISLAEQFWRAELKGFTVPTPLPYDRDHHGNNESQSHGYAELALQLSAEKTARLQTLAQKNQLTLNTLIRGVWAMLLSRLSGETDLVFGATVSGRTSSISGIEEMIGQFINTLPIRVMVDIEENFIDLLKRLQRQQMAELQFEYTPLVQIQNWSEVARGTSLFESILVFENFPVGEYLRQERASLNIVEVDQYGISNYPLTVLVSPGSTLNFLFEYQTNRFNAEDIAKMAGYLQTLLDGVVENGERTISQLPILTAAQSHQLLVEFNDTARDYPREKGIHQLFEEQVERYPDRIAVVYQQEQLTYRELNQRANQLAHYLKRHGVGPDILVAICLDRSIDLIVGLLAILKADGAYLPLDPAYPLERLSFMLNDTQAAIIITTEEQLDYLPTHWGITICLDSERAEIAGERADNPISEVMPDNLAYISYTSGSTGLPKGVSVVHRGVVRLIVGSEYARLDEHETLLQLSPIAFDASTFEIWGALLKGGKCVLLKERIPNGRILAEAIAENNVTTMWLTSSLFNFILDESAETFKGLKQLLVGGEALSVSHISKAQQLLPELELINGYGPTESTTFTCTYPIKERVTSTESSISIGKPIANTTVYILDESLASVPVGVAGEVYIGGDGLARGYLNRPELTAERFIPNPYHPRAGSRMYRTGDLARYLEDGNIEFIGRVDHQVKVRGFRIELGEIETVLTAHPAIDQAVVMVREERAEKRLVAYLVLNYEDENIDISNEIRSYLKERLPEYMIPATYLVLAELPLSVNGKIDRKALLSTDQIYANTGRAYLAPRNSIEEHLSEIWAEVLGLEQVGAQDNYFSLGGDSIRSIKVQSLAIERGLEFSLPELFQYQTVEELARVVRVSTKREISAISIAAFELIDKEDREKLPSDLEDAYPLTALQTGMLFHSEFNPESAVYHDIFNYLIRSQLNLAAFEIACQMLIDRHQMLRTSFDLKNYRQPLQLVHREVKFTIGIEDLSEASSHEQTMRLAALIEQEKARHFDWNKPPLLRIHIHKYQQDTYQFILSFHHAILDGWSVATMLTDLFLIYFAILDGEREIEPAPRSLFRDYVAEELKVTRSAESKQYWFNRLSDCNITKLPRLPKQPTSSKRVQHLRVEIPTEVSEGLKLLAELSRSHIKSALLAAHLKVLSFLTSQADVTTGFVQNGRLQEHDGERVLGLFLNSLPLRLTLSDGSWLDLVRDCFEMEQEMLPHRHYPMALVQKDLGERQLFETLFNYVHFHVYQKMNALKGIEVLGGSLFEETNYTLAAIFGQDVASSGVSLTLQYDTAELSEQQAREIEGYYLRTLTAMASQPLEKHHQFSPLSEAASRELLIDWNSDRAVITKTKVVHQLFEAQAALTPNAIAAVFNDQQLSYQALNCRANQLAHYLQKQGIGPEKVVAVCLDRSIDMLVGLLAILKAGGAYLPLDPASPLERLLFILSDAGSPILLTAERESELAQSYQGQIVCFDTHYANISCEREDNLINEVTSENLAYLIYTSGTTGKPKGVEVQHASLLNLIEWHNRAYQVTSADRATQIANLAFDASVWEIWPYLSVGAAIYLPQEDLISEPSRLIQWLIDQEITICFLPTPLAEIVIDQPWPERVALSRLLIGGDRLRRGPIKELPFRLFNNYGPTENTVVTTYGEVSGELDNLSNPDIGKPITNTQVYLLDSNLLPVAVGVTGELYIGGDSLARGYLNRPELTAEKFIPNPFAQTAGERLYKTGDLARWFPTGRIEFIGRIDDQVKLRGFRIELGEIEAALAAHAALSRAVVAIREDQTGNKRLIAYVVARPGQSLSSEELSDLLKARLPYYMIPTAFVFINELPLLPNGKIDRKALPDPEPDITTRAKNFVAPRNSIEHLLADIWAKVLGIKQPGVYDSFFDLGGDSILSLQIVSRANQAGLRLTPRQIFQYQTIAELAQVAEFGATIDTEQGLVTGSLPLTPIQRWFFEQEFTAPHHWNQSLLLKTRQHLDENVLKQALTRLIEHHDALRIRYVATAKGWQQHNAAEAELPLTVIDLKDIPAEQRETAIEEVANRLQSSLDLSAGPLIRVGLIECDNSEARLLIVIHHLVVDGVSWRILLEDLQLLYTQISNGETAALPAKTSSFKQWAISQQQYADSTAMRAEEAYWLALPWEKVSPLPLDKTTGDNIESSANAVTVSLTRVETQSLLEEIPAVYHTQINDLLLTALLLTYHNWTGKDVLAINLEGHGREDIINGIDLTRTVGWFTSLFPVLLEIAPNNSLAFTIRSVKEQLRKLKNSGIGYGMLRYLADSTGAQQFKLQPSPEISFNYLGQFDQVLSASNLFAAASESSGYQHSPLAKRAELFSVNSLIVDGQLQISWSYSENLHNRATVTTLAESYIAALRNIIEHCQSTVMGGYTPSDFPLAKLDQPRLDLLISDQNNIENIYPLSPMQREILRETLRGSESGVYLVQMCWTINGLNLSAFQKAWQELVNRHAIFRSSFHFEGLDEPVQIVHRNIDLPFELLSEREITDEDWSALSLTKQNERLRIFLNHERLKGLPLTQAPLIRLQLIKSQEEQCHFVLTVHHLLLDRWSTTLLFNELQELYQCFCQDREISRQKAQSYSEYISWIAAQDTTGSASYWQRRLTDFSPLLLTADEERAGNPQEIYQENSRIVSAEVTERLRVISKESQITLNSIVQGSWAMLLSSMAESKDVVFGVTLADRPADLADIESVVGLLINTLPMRIKIDPNEPLIAWLKSVNADNIELQQYSYNSLKQIHAWAGISADIPLFETILRFQNTPGNRELLDDKLQINMEHVYSVDHWHYPICVVITPDRELRITTTYNSHRFSESWINLMLDRYQKLLELIASHPDYRLKQLLED